MEDNTREGLKELVGERIAVTGIRGRISPALERSSSPKMVVQMIEVYDYDGPRVHHVWITPPKNATTCRGAILGFTGIVEEYISLDKTGLQVTKYGLKSIRNFKTGRNRNDALSQTIESIREGQRNHDKIKAKYEKKKEEDKHGKESS